MLFGEPIKRRWQAARLSLALQTLGHGILRTAMEGETSASRSTAFFKSFHDLQFQSPCFVLQGIKFE